MRILVAASLYPNPAAPTRGLFVRERVRHTALRGHEVRVIAPVPWIPILGTAAGGRRGAAVPALEERDGLPVAHPRWWVAPAIGALFHGWSYRAALARSARETFPSFRPEIVDAHYLYPDGFGAVLYARRRGLPVVVSARGTDVNVIADDPLLGPMVRFTLRRATRVIAVSEELRTRIVALGVPPARVRTVPNGVDVRRFSPRSRADARRRLGFAEEGTLVLSVGHLVKNKGHHHLVRAMASPPARLAPAHLWIAGEGAERPALERLAASLGVADRVRLLGSRSPDELPDLYAAADVFALATEREGWPNAVVEALACGVPVVATRTGGIPELVSDGAQGFLVDDPGRDMPAALERALARSWDRDRVAERVRSRGWDTVAREVEEELSAALADGPRDDPRGSGAA